MAYDELKRIAGVHVGATPQLKKKPPAPPAHGMSPHPPNHPSNVVRPPAPMPTHPSDRRSVRDTRTARISAPSRIIGGAAAMKASTASAVAASPALASIAVAAGLARPSAGTPPPAPPADADAAPPPFAADAPAPPSLMGASTSDAPAASSSSSSSASYATRSTSASSPSSPTSPQAPASSAWVVVDRASKHASRAPQRPLPSSLSTTTAAPHRAANERTNNMSGYRGGENVPQTYVPIASNAAIAGGAQGTATIKPQKPFQTFELLIDPVTGASFDILDIKIGNEPVSVASGGVSALCFPPQNGPKFRWAVADGVDIVFTLLNTTTVAAPFKAMLVGEVVDRT